MRFCPLRTSTMISEARRTIAWKRVFHDVQDAPRPNTQFAPPEPHENIKKQPSQRSTVYTVPGGTRTPDLLVRSQALYPAELQAHVITTKVIIAHAARKVNAEYDN